MWTRVLLGALIAVTLCVRETEAQTAPAPPAPQDQRILQAAEGAWIGTLERGGARAEFRLNLRVADGQLGGTFDWPDLGYLGADILGARERDGRVRIALPLPLGSLRMTGVPERNRFTGTLEETTRRANEWVTLPAEGGFTLRRAEAARLPYRVTPVRFASGDVQIAGEIYAPAGRGRRPAVVFIHGSGDSNRADGAFMADQFARAGIVTLVYDKRGVGESTGAWRDGGYEELAQDARAALELLRAREDVDAERVGYVCRSEGCWVAPIAVSRGGASFLAAISGPTITVADEDIDHYRVALREAGMSESDMQAAFALLRLRHAVIAGGAAPAELDARVAAVRNDAWFERLNWEEAEGDAGQFRARTIGYDPAPQLRALGVRSLWLYGTDDTIIPVGDSVERLLALNIEPRPSIIVLPRADHALAATQYPRLPGGVASAAQRIADWITGG
ncbi:MAG TPA: alpha/beta hydrolase [Candidatus Binatia bacterium]|nr:alpha/beta hydrolase [Candidatus Binatia bacterium]